MLISPKYTKLLEQTHSDDSTWGQSSPRFAPLISKIINEFGFKTALDYGCGKGKLADYLELDHQLAMYRYDPAVPAFSRTPRPVDFVICTDVLEHIEPDLIDEVMDDLLRVGRMAFINVCTVEARKILPDGRNAHLIIKGQDWWIPKILERWFIRSLSADEAGFWFIGTPL